MVSGSSTVKGGSSTVKDSAYNGVEFEVHIGHGTVTGPAPEDTRWVWSARVHWFADLLAKAFRAPRTGRLVTRPHTGLASVTSIGDSHRSAFGTGPRPGFSGFSAPPGPGNPPTCGQDPPWVDPSSYDQ